MYTPAEVLPHAAPMILIDEIVAFDETSLTAALIVPANGLFNDALFDGAVPAWVGIEYLAQAVAAHDGCRARNAGRAPRIGFLLGSRQFASNITAFAPGTRLTVEVHEIMSGDNGMAVYDGRISSEGIEITARINGFQPADPAPFLQGKTA